MNFRVILYALGGLLRLLGLFMLIPLGVAYYLWRKFNSFSGFDFCNYHYRSSPALL